MKKIAAKLGLPEASAEEAIIAAIDKKEQDLADARKALVDAVIAAGKKSGIVNDTNVASMEKLGATDLNLLVDLVIKPGNQADNTRISEVIAKMNDIITGKKEDVKDEKNWDWYQKNDPQALAVMKNKEPEKYDKLYKEFWG